MLARARYFGCNCRLYRDVSLLIALIMNDVYLHALCYSFRFLMNPGSNYEVFTMDPDVRVCWEEIEQVLIAVPQSCPICLQPPVAGRITKCGHVYCFSCILHYLALSESNKAWRKCPICWDSIYEKDLKSVRTVHGDLDAFDQGEKEIAKQIASHQEVQLEMRLIQRSMVIFLFYYPFWAPACKMISIVTLTCLLLPLCC